MEEKKRRKGIVIMGQLVGLVKPLLPLMCLAVLLGVLGYLCAIFLTILAGYGLLHGLFTLIGLSTDAANVGFFLSRSPGSMATLWLCWRFCGACFITGSSTVITLSRLNCWRLSGIKYLQRFGSSVRQSWREGIREI